VTVISLFMFVFEVMPSLVAVTVARLPQGVARAPR
jgi:hypothetical protein